MVQNPGCRPDRLICSTGKNAVATRLPLRSPVNYELFKADGEPSRYVSVRLSDTSFQIYTQDLGKSVEETFGDADYEFWTEVPREAWGQLLVAMAIELYEGKRDATDQLEALCKRHDIPHRWASWT